jgi:hypothetical protein
MWKKFVEATMRHFRFLETEFGFTCKSAKPPFVIYESNRLRALVFYDVNGRHELDFRVRRLGDDPRKVPGVRPTEIMLLTDLQPAEKYQSPFPSTEATLEAEVQRLAELIQKYGQSILKGDDRVFERIERLRREREAEVVAQMQPINRLKK